MPYRIVIDPLLFENLHRPNILPIPGEQAAAAERLFGQAQILLRKIFKRNHSPKPLKNP
jgi:hypothetical protein